MKLKKFDKENKTKEKKVEKASSRFDKIFIKEEKITNQNIIKTIGWVCFLGPILMLGKLLNIFPHMEYKALLIYTIETIIVYAVLFSITFFTKNFASKSFIKYIYMFAFNLEIWFLAFCPGVDVKLGYLIVPVIACIYLNERFMVITNVLSYFTVVFCVFTKYYLGNVPNYIDISQVTNLELISYVSQLTTGRQWLIYNLVCMSLEFLLFLWIQLALIKKARKLVRDNSSKKRDIVKLQHGLISGFANLVEIKDVTTGFHIARVSAYTKLICNALLENPLYKDYLDDETINQIIEASPLHDLGKIAIEDSIITKTTLLTTDEYEKIKQHPQYGAQIIDRYLKPYEDKEYISIAKDIALYHHEWWNGNGYPYGLKENDIPVSARIISVADVLDGLLSKRPYKQAFDIDKTFEMMKSLAGSQFDPAIIEVLPPLKEEVERISKDTTGIYTNNMGIWIY